MKFWLLRTICYAQHCFIYTALDWPLIWFTFEIPICTKVKSFYYPYCKYMFFRFMKSLPSLSMSLYYESLNFNGHIHWSLIRSRNTQHIKICCLNVKPSEGPCHRIFVFYIQQNVCPIYCRSISVTTVPFLNKIPLSITFSMERFCRVYNVRIHSPEFLHMYMYMYMYMCMYMCMYMYMYMYMSTRKWVDVSESPSKMFDKKGSHIKCRKMFRWSRSISMTSAEFTRLHVIRNIFVLKTSLKSNLLNS